MKRFCVIALFVLTTTDVFADSLRCGRSLVKVGDSTNILMKKCGDPLRKFTSKETISDHGRQLTTSVSNWVYTRNGKKDMIVSVHSGSVLKIQTD